MTPPSARRPVAVIAVCVLAVSTSLARAAAPLSSWNDGPAKARIVGFVQAVTDPSGKDCAPRADRIAAFGNSAGDSQMRERVTSVPGTRLPLIVQPNDAEREFAYDRALQAGKLERGRDEGLKRGWPIVSTKGD